MIPMMINIAGFYLGWFACILGAARGLAALGPAVVFVLVIVHLKLHRPRRAELALAGISLVLGFAVDSAMTAAGVMVPVRDIMPEGLTTLWLMCMWVNFALTLNAALRCLHGRPWIAALLGVLGGPAAYYTGAGLGAIVIPDPLWFHLAVIGAAWGLVTPLLVWCGRRLKDRFTDAADDAGSDPVKGEIAAFLEGGALPSPLFMPCPSPGDAAPDSAHAIRRPQGSDPELRADGEGRPAAGLDSDQARGGSIQDGSGPEGLAETNRARSESKQGEKKPEGGQP